MKIRALQYALLLSIMYIPIGLMAQEAKTDSLLEVKEKNNSAYLSDLKSKKTDTKAKAKEAQRVERNATNAAVDSRKAYRSERKAQKSRQDADRQAKRAKKSRIKSDNNK